MSKAEILKALQDAIANVDAAMDGATRVRDYIFNEGRRAAFEEAFNFLAEVLPEDKAAEATTAPAAPAAEEEVGCAPMPATPEEVKAAVK